MMFGAMYGLNARSRHAGRRRFLAQTGALGTSLSLLGSLGCRTGAPRIDAHQHFWTYGAENYSWIDPASVVARDFTPADLEPQLRALNIDGTVAVEARSQVDETEDLLEHARQNRFVRGVVGWLPLVDAKVGDLIDRYASDPKLRGLRHAIAAEADPDFMLREDFNRGVALLHRAGHGAGLRFDLLLVPANLSRAPAFVDRHPRQIFILDHLAKPGIEARQVEPWATQLRELARRPNVYCKVSGLVTEADRRSWTPSDLRPYLDVALEAFTPERLLFGSDWPMCLLATTYGGWLSTVHDWVSALSPHEQRRILGESAIEAYGL
jgi:L-fucono-1,5-lactonase